MYFEKLTLDQVRFHYFMEMFLDTSQQDTAKEHHNNIMCHFAIKKIYLHSLLVDADCSYYNLPIKYKFSGVVTGILTSFISSSSPLSQELELAQAQL